MEMSGVPMISDGNSFENQRTKATGFFVFVFVFVFKPQVFDSYLPTHLRFGCQTEKNLGEIRCSIFC